jgi:hypothetical protein
MNDDDAKTYEESAREYRARKRRAWRSFLFFLASFFSAGIAFHFEKLWNSTGRNYLGDLWVFVVFALWCWFLVQWFWLNLFRCPRCRKRFTSSWYGFIPTACCHNCKLRLE